MKIFNHQIKCNASLIISDDTGKLLQLIHAITILCGMLITLLTVITPVVVMINDVVTTVQQVILDMCTWPVLQMATG